MHKQDKTVRSSFFRGYKYYKSAMFLSQRIITRKLKGQGHQTKSQLIEVQSTQRRFYVFHFILHRQSRDTASERSQTDSRGQSRWSAGGRLSTLYTTLYSKSKMSLNQEKLLMNHINMSTILFIM